MKILFLTDNFPPEVNAPATRTFEHCVEWVKQGAEITVITSFPNFPQGKVYNGYRNKLKQIEWIKGIKIIRIWTYMAPNKGFIRRLIDFNSYALSSLIAGLFIKKEIIISTSPQFFTSFSGYLLSRKKNTKWVFEVRDLWPESLWMLKRESLVYKIFSWFECFFYKNADKIVVVTQSFKDTIINKGINPEKISLHYNGTTFENSNILNNEINSIRKKLNLNDRIILGYIGTFGVAQNLPFFLNIAHTLLIKYPLIHLLFIGDGADRFEMESILKDNNFKNVTILPPIPKKEVNIYLAAIDYGLVPLRNNEVYHKVIPSKIFEIAAKKKPIFLGVEGEAKSIINKYKIGVTFIPENQNDFFEQLEKLLKLDPRKIKYEKFYNDFNRKTIALKYFYDLKKMRYEESNGKN